MGNIKRTLSDMEDRFNNVQTESKNCTKIRE